MLGVFLARTVFVDRQNAALGRRQSFRETLPLTLAAMLIAGAIIYDRKLGFSAATFTGLGIGWTAIVLLDVIGKRLLRLIDPAAAVAEDAPNLIKPVPPEMADAVDRIDRKDAK